VLTHLQNLLLSVSGMRLCTALKQPEASEQGEQGQRPLPQLLGHLSSAHPEILKYGIDRPNKEIIAPKNITQTGQHQCFWCIAAELFWRRLSAAAYGCALLQLVIFALDELAVSQATEHQNATIRRLNL